MYRPMLVATSLLMLTVVLQFNTSAAKLTADSESGHATPTADLPDLERVLLMVMMERDGALLPYFRNYVQPDADDSFHALTLELQLLGRCDTANGEWLVALIQFEADGQDSDGPFGTGRRFLAYLSSDMELADHHGIGCGTVTLDGSVLKLDASSFDLSTDEGIAELRKTSRWC